MSQFGDALAPRDDDSPCPAGHSPEFFPAGLSFFVERVHGFVMLRELGRSFFRGLASRWCCRACPESAVGDVLLSLAFAWLVGSFVLLV